jgi:serine/threonine protein kinase
VEWERIRPLGSGGQSDVFLVRSPSRTAERAECLETIRKALDEDKRADLADAIYSYARSDSPAELGALKIFKIPPEAELPPALGSDDYEAAERLKNEIIILGQGRPGLLRLLDSNLKQRWIVTEFFPEGTLEQHAQKFRGNTHSALRAFRSLVDTVASLHKEGYVHRDIKPDNVFVRNDDQLVLGDFGIVYVPTASERITLTGERVGPRDYMPPWANLGIRHEKVEPCFDVYMLGKLLWSMVDGRTFVPREYYDRAEFDLTNTFRDEPDMFLINQLLKRCIVEAADRCLSSAQDLLLAVDTILRAMELGGQLLSESVPRPCHVCGNGFYQPQELRKHTSTAGMRLWISGGATDIEVLGVQVFSCDKCGHVQFFKKPFRS